VRIRGSQRTLDRVSNTKFSAPSKIYIARLLGLDVFDPFGDRLGRLRDVVVLKRGFGAA